jgi:hypothetical protein
LEPAIHPGVNILALAHSVRTCADAVKFAHQSLGNPKISTLLKATIKKKLQEYEHIMPKRVQTCPYSPEPKRFGTKAQAPLPHDASPKLDAKGIKHVQKIGGSYYITPVLLT